MKKAINQPVFLKNFYISCGLNESEYSDKYENDYQNVGFWTIKTTAGYFDLEVRNSHNGYYGGHIILRDIKNSADFEKEYKNIAIWKELKEDF